MQLWPIGIVMCINNSCVVLHCRNILYLSIHSFLDHWPTWRASQTMNKAAKNKNMHGFLVRTYVFISLGYTPRSRMAGSSGNSVFNFFLRKIPKMTVPFHIPTNNIWVSPGGTFKTFSLLGPTPLRSGMGPRNLHLTSPQVTQVHLVVVPFELDWIGSPLKLSPRPIVPVSLCL